MVRAVREGFLPDKVVLLVQAEKEEPEIKHIASFTKDMKSIDGRATAYVCIDYHCELPTTEINRVLELLDPYP